MPPTRPTVDTVMRRGAMAKPAGSVRDPERLDRGLVVGQRLAHAHVHEVREPAARLEHPRGADHLRDDLARAEIPLEPHRAREAEGAREAAADLRRHAEREPVAVGHQHRLHTSPIGEDEDDLLAAILRRRPALHLGHADERALGQDSPEVARQIGHGVDIDGTLLVDPRRKLPPAIPGPPRDSASASRSDGKRSNKFTADIRGTG